MIGFDAQAWGILLGALAALVLAVAVAWAIVRRLFGSVTAEVGQVKVKLDGITSEVQQINRAVNHVPEGDIPLVQRVRLLEQHQQWVRRTLTLLAVQLGVNIDHNEEA